MIRFVGAVLVIVSCGGFGCTMSSYYRKVIRMLHQLFFVLQEMEWELKYRLTPLPELCGVCATSSSGELREVFLMLKKELETGVFAEISGCMNAILQTIQLPCQCSSCLKELSNSLGRYDLDGQLQGLEAVKERCRSYLEVMESHRPERLRSYHTLALCAGGALLIILV